MCVLWFISKPIFATRFNKYTFSSYVSDEHNPTPRQNPVTGLEMELEYQRFDLMYLLIIIL